MGRQAEALTVTFPTRLFDINIMKITLCLSFLTLGITFSALAQGRINFANTSATPIRISSGGTTLVLGTASTAAFGIGPASVRIQLYASLNSSDLGGLFPPGAPVLIGIGANQASVTNTASTVAIAQGTFSGGLNLPLAGFDGSQPVFLKMTGIAINGTFWGESPIIQVNLATGSDAAAQVFSPVADASHWNGLIIGVPEPASGVLLGWGGAWVLFQRRRPSP